MVHSRLHHDGSSAFTRPPPDYEADDVLVVGDPEQLRALGGELRSRIVDLLRERAASTAQVAAALDLPQSTVRHHLNVLEKAGLIRVVRTRQVRAMTEKVYGRVARLFLFTSADGDGTDVRNIAAASLRRAAEEMLPLAEEDGTTFGLVRARLTQADARRLERRLKKVVDDFLAADSPDGDPRGLAVALYRRAAGA